MHTPASSGGLDRYFNDLSLFLGAHRPEHLRSVAFSKGNEATTSNSGEDKCLATLGSSSLPLIERWKRIKNEFHNTRFIRHPLIVSHFCLYAFALRKHLKSNPHVVHFHGPWAGESKAEGARKWTVLAKKAVEQSVYRTGDRFIVLSDAFKEVLVQDYSVNPSRVKVIPGGVFTSDYETRLGRSEARARLGWEKSAPTVLCIRRLAHRMGLQNLIEAWVQVAAKYPDARLKIGGIGPLKQDLAMKIQSSGLSGKVELLGFIPDEELALSYRAADFSIVPSSELEGFGLITLESMASGTPPLVTPVGGLPTAVQGLESKLVMNGSDVASLTDGLNAALSGAIKLPTAETCQEHVRRNFDWSVITPRIQAVYEEAAALYRE